MKKTKLLFNGSVFKNALDAIHWRSGIYFCSKNILNEMQKRKNLELYIYFEAIDDKVKEKLLSFLSISELKILTAKDDLSDIDVFFSPLEKIPDIIKEYPQITCYTILYDLIPLIYPEHFTENRWFHELYASLNKNDFYFSISDHTKKDFLKYNGNLDADKITTIPLSTNLVYKPNKDEDILEKVRNKYNLPNRKYVYSLCSLEPRKNLIRSVRSFIKFIEKNKIDDLVYILGGKAWGNFDEVIEKEIPDYNKYKDRIIKTGYVDDEDLEVLYSNAEWFVYTSQYEGFGMPPLEAMSCGCPVITSNNSSLPEVVGDAGIMIDYDSDEQHIAAYEKYYFDNDYRQQMGKQGLERSKLFSWKKTVDIIVEKINEIEKRKSQTPKVTVITASYNLLKAGREKTFRQCLESVHNQTYQNIEHIIIDGASTDGALDLIKEYENKGWVKCYSEPDKGIYDAMNKGILKAKGKYVVCLNSDDFYCDNQAVELLVKKAEEQEADACYASSNVLSENNNSIAKWNGLCTFFPPFGEMPNHQTFMIKTDVMKELGLYNLKYKVSADSNFIYNMVKHGKKLVFLNKFIIGYRLGGLSDKWQRQVLADQENSFLEFWAQDLHLTPLEVHNLAHNNFNAIALHDALKLGSKLERPEWIEEYYKRLFNHYLSNRNIVDNFSINQNKSKKYYLFGFIPLLKIKGTERKKKYCLFNFIPLFKYKEKTNKKKYYLFNFIPLLKIKGNEHKKKYYLFDFIPLLKLKKK